MREGERGATGNVAEEVSQLCTGENASWTGEWAHLSGEKREVETKSMYE